MSHSGSSIPRHLPPSVRSAGTTTLANSDDLQPTAARAYRMGILAQQAAHDDLAIADFQRAVARNPAETLYLESLAYACRHAGQTARAADLFSQAIARDPDRVSLYRDLAYAQLSLGQPDLAAGNLKAAIDLQLGHPPKDVAPAQADTDLANMRDEYGSLIHRFSTTIYESYRPNGGVTAAAASSGGLIPSQGGAEFVYRPWGLFGRQDDALQFGARLLWSNRPKGLAIDHESLQGGLAVRYKPLQSQDFFVSAERLIKIGNASQSDWLLRASFGLGREVELHPGKAHWNYTRLYADAGYFTDARATALYAEFSQGISLRASDHFLVTPHVTLVEHHQNPDPARTSVLEAGPGLAFKFLLGASRYETQRASIDLVVQYRARITGDGKSDWAVTSLFRF
jgi:bacteriophage N4 adsorption protein A